MEKDPDNALLWKFSHRRLEAEEIRDSMLAIAGRLNLKIGGPSFMVPIDPELVLMLKRPQYWVATRDKSEYDRRTLYDIYKRNLRLPFVEVFDAPDTLLSCARREQSTHAPQALELLNGKTSNELAAALAAAAPQGAHVARPSASTMPGAWPPDACPPPAKEAGRRLPGRQSE